MSKFLAKFGPHVNCSMAHNCGTRKIRSVQEDIYMGRFVAKLRDYLNSLRLTKQHQTLPKPTASQQKETH